MPGYEEAAPDVVEAILDESAKFTERRAGAAQRAAATRKARSGRTRP